MGLIPIRDTLKHYTAPASTHGYIKLVVSSAAIRHDYYYIALACSTELAGPLSHTAGPCEVALYELKSSVVLWGRDPHRQSLAHVKFIDHVEVGATRCSGQHGRAPAAFELNGLRAIFASETSAARPPDS